jgi:hypothetical protein
MKTRRHSAARTLYGPTVQDADGKVVRGEPLDVEYVLTKLERLDSSARSAFFCIFAHDLTVAVRSLLLDRPVSEADLDRVSKINEIMHQLTSCAKPRGAWSAGDETLMLRAIIDGSFSYDLDRWVGHALAIAAGNILADKKSVAVT